MALTRRCDYAFRIIRAAHNHEGSYVSIADVAKEEGIPYSFARSIQHDLVKAGFLTTNRGVHGGLALSCDLHEVTMLDVLECMQDSAPVAECVSCTSPCPRKGTCAFNAAWRAADALLRNLYSSITLSDLFELGAEHPAIKAVLAAGE